MAPVPATKKRANPRKRNRKRKRRNVSSSSSSSSEISSSSSSESENDEGEREPTTVKLPQKRPSAVSKSAAVNASTTTKAVDDSSSSGSDVALDSDAGSDSEPESGPEASFLSTFSSPTKEAAASTAQERDGATSQPTHKPRPPSPRNVPEPSILDGDKEKEEALRARFRQFWLGCVADAFADDLNEIRKEPNLTPARLSLLIDSLAAGANVYSSSSGPASNSASDGNRQQVNEMEVVLGE
ncbi:hypothetical protein ACEPAI_9221 [Sanghuangporus weigelae]